jgi:hypothetical protein
VACQAGGKAGGGASGDRPPIGPAQKP